MQEKNRFAMRPDFRIPVAKYARASRFKLITRGQNIVDLVTDMMNTARGVLFKESLDRGYNNSILVLGSSTKTTVTP